MSSPAPREKISSELCVPDGHCTSRSEPDSGQNEPLSLFLESNGIDLNYRCGKKGNCTGCEIYSEEIETPQKACQLNVKNFLGMNIRIPFRSQRRYAVSEVSDFEINLSGVHPTPRQGMGLVIDIGTTTVELTVWDLKRCSNLGRISGHNTQDHFGDNLIARISHTIDCQNGLFELH